jgi:hypothetical protein
VNEPTEDKQEKEKLLINNTHTHVQCIVYNRIKIKIYNTFSIEQSPILDRDKGRAYGNYVLYVVELCRIHMTRGQRSLKVYENPCWVGPIFF